MGQIKKLYENQLVGASGSNEVYPVTSTKAVYDKNNNNLQTVLDEQVIKTTDVVNDLTTGGEAVPLSAEQGKALDAKILTYGQEPYGVVQFTGKGQTSQYTDLYSLLPGNTYRMHIASWPCNTITGSTNIVLAVYSYDANNVSTVLYSCTVANASSVPEYLDITIPTDSVRIHIGGRTNTDADSRLYFEDITLVEGATEAAMRTIGDISVTETQVSPTYSSGYISKTNGEVTESENYKYTTINVGTATRIRFLGNSYAVPSSWLNGYAFYNSSDECIAVYSFDASSGSNKPKEYLVTIPDGAVYFKISVYIGTETYNVIRPTNFYCYLQYGATVKDLLDEKVEEDALNDAVYGRTEYVDEVIDLSEIVEQDLSFSVSTGYFLSSGKHALIEVYPDDVIKITGNGGNVAFVSYIGGPRADWGTGHIAGTLMNVEVGKEYTLCAPANSVGFIFSTEASAGISTMPLSLIYSRLNVERPTFRDIPCRRFIFDNDAIAYGAQAQNANFLIKIKGGHKIIMKHTENATVYAAYITELPRIGLSDYTSIDFGTLSTTLNKECTRTLAPAEDCYVLGRIYKSSSPTITYTIYDADYLYDRNNDYEESWRYNINNLTKRNYRIDESGTYSTSSTYKHVLIPVTPGQYVKMIPNASGYNIQFAWLTESITPVSREVPPFVPGTGVIQISTGGIVKVPEGANYMYVYAGSSASGWPAFPSYLGVSVNYNDMPDVVRDNNYLETRRLLFQLKSTTRGENDVNYKPLVLLHYSDIHGRTVCQDRINEFREFFKTYIDDTIQTGDLVTNNWADESAFGDETNPDNPCKDILCILGNHDTAHKSGSEIDNWHYYQGKDAYDRFFAPWIENWNVTQPEGADENGYCFYYKDYADSKIRLIAIDPFNNDADYTTAQQAWFVDTLNDAITQNLSVIIASHYRIKCETLLKSPFTMPSAAVENPDTSVANDPYLPLVKSFIDDGGKFVCWITGHSHYDAISKTSDEMGGQINICVNRAGAFGSTSTSLWETNSRIGVDFADWKTFDCFNIMAVDTYLKFITLYRIGSNWDKMGRKIETCCIKYDTGEVLYP